MTNLHDLVRAAIKAGRNDQQFYELRQEAIDRYGFNAYNEAYWEVQA